LGARVPRVISDQLVKPRGILAGEVGHDVDAPVALQILRELALGDLFLFRHRLELDHRHVAAGFERAVLVEHRGGGARHAGGEVAAGHAEYDDDAAGHVFAAVVAGPFHDDGGARITHGEAFAGDAAEITFAGDGAIHHGIADDDRLLRYDARLRRRAD